MAYRIRDILFSLFFISIFFIPMTLIAAVLALTFGKNFIFRDTRVGFQGKDIVIFKFKTMRDKNVEGHIFSQEENDARIIKCGRFLRKHRLDELPQFFNVLTGDLSLVGPRPEQKKLNAVISSSIKEFSKRHKVRPGITGLAQVELGYTTDIKGAAEKLKLDLLYIENRSLIFDFKILFKTIFVMISGQGSK